MSDDENLGEIVFHEVDRFDEPLPPLYILRTKSFVDDESLQACAFSLCEDLGEGEPDREIDAEGFPARIHFVISNTCRVADLNIESLFQVIPFLVLVLCLCDKTDGHI